MRELIFTHPDGRTEVRSIPPPRMDEARRKLLLRKLGDAIADASVDKLEVYEDSNWLLCESPIEMAFGLAWQALHYLHHITGHPLEQEPVLKAQVEVTAGGRDYRLDFAFVGYGAKIAIECDGHAFHERTPEQVDYRNSRDRDLQADGWLVFHFSGREIYRQPMTCALRVYDAIYQAYFNTLRSSRG